MTPDDIASLKTTAFALADAAGEAILPYFRTALTAENKSTDGFDPVTAADKAAERAMRDVLAANRPGDGILGEEYDDKTSETGLTWVLDPIDGTRGFLSGTPTWGVLIAVHAGDAPVLGVIDQPYIQERFWGHGNTAGYKGPHGAGPLAVRGIKDLSQAIVFSTFPEVGTKAEQAAFQTVAQHCRLTRYGTDCYAYALLAAGQIDLVIEAGLQPYDIQGPMAVVQAAGGIVTTWDGGPAQEGGRIIAAATPELHAAALAHLAGVT